MGLEVEVNMQKVYDAKLSIHALSLLGYFVKKYSDEGHIAGVDFEEWKAPLEELIQAGLVKRYGRNIKIDPTVARLI